jgi:2-polyprenyl-3-methyl-5-hydroxy-6-metoxy-1,4-benzoquinol methylase
MTGQTEIGARAQVPYDHSITYRDGRIKNLPHRMRLRSIFALLHSVDFADKNYADVGCSNGYITALVNERFHPARACGLDANEPNLQRARAEHPGIDFRSANINEPMNDGFSTTYHVVTCFETLEHVGDLDNAIDNLLRVTRPGGVLFVSVPIEIGLRGALKFAAKLVYGYRLNELPQTDGLYWKYIRALLLGERISSFRDKRPGWGTHFGFDYRAVDDIFRRRSIPFVARNDFTTRLYRAVP